MADEMGFALIGGGAIGQVHAREIHSTPGARLVAVAGETEEKAGKLAEQYGAAWYRDYREMLANPEIRVVNICTPSGMHGDMAVEAARAGKHVIVEKPMEINMEKADLMIAEAKRCGVGLSVISQHRFDPSTLQVRQDLEAGRFGRIVLAEAAVNWYRTQAYYDSADWRGTWDMDGGGVLMNQSIHTIDLLLHFMGEVKSVHAHMRTAAHDRIEVEDVLVATIVFKNDTLCTVSCTTAAYPGYASRIELFGTEGSAVIENDILTHRHFITQQAEIGGEPEAGKEEEVKTAAGSDPMALSGAAHRAQIKDMMDAIREEREPAINGADGRRALQLILALYQSARENKEIML